MAKPILHELANLLYSRIGSAEDRAELVQLGEVGRLLEPLFAEQTEPDLSGLGKEFYLWAGLKIDKSDMADDYGPGIKKTYPEVFAE